MADSIFPFIDIPPDTAEQASTEPLMAREYAWDFENNCFLLKDGKFQVVEGKEAVKIWLWKIFHTPRYRYLIYSWDYGNELEELIGKNYSQSALEAEAKRLIEEAIFPTLEGYVTEIKNVSTMIQNGVVKIDFTAVTPYGEVNMSV